MSHFSTVKTELRQMEPLVKALEDMGYAPDQGERPVRGYRGQTVTADLAIAVQDGGDIGFRWNSASESYELVTDLDLWKQQIPVERFLSKLTQRYALNRFWLPPPRKDFRLPSRPKPRMVRSNSW